MPRRLLLLGAPGSGKTTLIAKLASRPRREPVRISWMPGVDPASLVAYAGALGLCAEPVGESPNDPSEIAMVEAPGLATSALRRGHSAVFDEARELCREACLTPVLVLPAESGVADAAEIAAAAMDAGVEHLAITRLDQAKHFGAVLAASSLGGLQLTTASINPHMAYGLRGAHAGGTSQVDAGRDEQPERPGQGLFCRQRAACRSFGRNRPRLFAERVLILVLGRLLDHELTESGVGHGTGHVHRILALHAILLNRYRAHLDRLEIGDGSCRFRTCCRRACRHACDTSRSARADSPGSSSCYGR